MGAWHKQLSGILYLDHEITELLGLRSIPHVSTIHFDIMFDIMKKNHCSELTCKSSVDQLNRYKPSRTNIQVFDSMDEEKNREDSANFLFSICPTDFGCF